MTESLTVLCVVHEASALRIHDMIKKKKTGGNFNQIFRSARYSWNSVGAIVDLLFGHLV